MTLLPPRRHRYEMTNDLHLHMRDGQLDLCYDNTIVDGLLRLPRKPFGRAQIFLIKTRPLLGVIIRFPNTVRE